MGGGVVGGEAKCKDVLHFLSLSIAGRSPKCSFLGETEFGPELRELMKEAQANKKGRWASYEAPTMTGKTNFHAKVIEVVSGDCAKGHVRTCRLSATSNRLRCLYSLPPTSPSGGSLVTVPFFVFAISSIRISKINPRSR